MDYPSREANVVAAGRFRRGERRMSETAEVSAPSTPFLPRIITRFAVPILLLWVGLTAAVNLGIPQLEAVGKAHSVSLSPKDAAAVQAIKHVEFMGLDDGCDLACEVLADPRQLREILAGPQQAGDALGQAFDGARRIAIGTRAKRIVALDLEQFGRPVEHLGEPHRLGDQVGVGGRRLAPPHPQVVLQADADVSAEHQREGRAQTARILPRVRQRAAEPQLLDPPGIVELIVRVRDTFGTTIVVVSHELASIFDIADRVIMLDRGDKGIIAEGRPRELAVNSADARVSEFLRRGDVLGKTP